MFNKPKKPKQKEQKPYKIPTVTKAQLRKRKVIDILLIVGPVLLVFFLLKWLFLIGIVPSASMFPFMNTDSGIIANRFAYISAAPQRGDVIVFQKGDSILTKRIIGVPGDKLSIQNDIIYINEQPIVEDYVAEGIRTLPLTEINYYDVPEDCYFVLGDNRENSNDSRAWGNPFVPRSDIKAKVLCVFSINPFSHGFYYRSAEPIDIAETYSAAPVYDPENIIASTTAAAEIDVSKESASGNIKNVSPTLPVVTIAPESISDVTEESPTEETIEEDESSSDEESSSIEGATSSSSIAATTPTQVTLDDYGNVVDHVGNTGNEESLDSLEGELDPENVG